MTTKQTKRASILGYPVDLVNKDTAVDFVLNCMKNNKGIHIRTINPEIIALADKTPELAEIIKKSELIIPESSGIIMGLKRQGINDIDQIPGIEFSEDLLKKCAEKELKVAFLGGSQEVIELLNKEIKKIHPNLNIVFYHNGYFSEKELVNIIKTLKNDPPHLLLVAIGAPKQEFLINKCRRELYSTVMIGVGGSFDVWAKKIKRAPIIFRMFGLEWLHRLIKQPSRFNRMFPTLPLFFLKIMFKTKSSKKN